MQFRAHFSSSAGNLYTVTSATGKVLLIDPGVPWRKLRQALNSDLSGIVGCLLTHEHADHSKAIEDVMLNGIDVYAGSATFEALGIDPVEEHRAKVIYDCDRFKIGKTFQVLPFELWADKEKSAHAHDVPIYGFVIFTKNECMLFVTDASVIVARFALQFNIIALCCNYDGEILHAKEEASTINSELAKRLLTSHMEKQVAMDYIDKYCNLGKCTSIHLLHMSRTTIDAEKTRKEFEDKFFIKTFINDS